MAIPDLRKLQNAVVLAETGSFVRASDQLHLTQSALTRSVQALEAELGLRLFDRTKQGVRPTPDGEEVLARARLLLLQARTLQREVALIRHAELGAVAFGVKAILESPSNGSGYQALCVEIGRFFKSGKPPVTPEETIEIFAFMEAADESKRRGGAPVSLAEVLSKAKAEAATKLGE